MGQDPGEGSAVTAEQLRSEIKQTREQLGDTAAALGAKADVKGRAKERVEETKTTIKRNPAPLVAVGAVIVGVAVLWVVARRRRS